MDESIDESGPVAVPIRYDGLDAERHQIELHLLGESLQGMARILAVSGHFLATKQYAKQLQALDVKVYVDEPKANCFTVQAVLDFAKEQQLLAGTITLLPAFLAWIFAKASNDRVEMKALKDSLDKAIGHLAGQNTELVPKLLATVEKMSDSLRPSVRAAVAPVGKSCTHMTVGGSSGTVVDQARADAIRSTAADEVTHERTWDIVITEFDRESATAKIRFTDEEYGADEKRVRAVITDPSVGILGNAYVKAFAAHSEIRVRGKAVLRDGEIQTLYISDSDASSS